MNIQWNLFIRPSISHSEIEVENPKIVVPNSEEQKKTNFSKSEQICQIYSILFEIL
jgi:hypothetical protein